VKICQTHWEELIKALEERDLMKYVASDSKSAIQRLQAQLGGDDSDKTFEPLLGANFAIKTNFLGAVGLACFAPDAPCPLCFLDEGIKKGCGDPNCTRHHDSGSDWIRYAADDQLNKARELKLVPPVQ